MHNLECFEQRSTRAHPVYRRRTSSEAQADYIKALEYIGACLAVSALMLLVAIVYLANF